MKSLKSGKQPVSYQYMIILWGGLKNEIPEGWAVCDGTNGTPDLGTYLVKYGSYNITGGNPEVTTYIHYHPYKPLSVTTSFSTGTVVGSSGTQTDTTYGALSHNHTANGVVSTNTSGLRFPVDPPYIALYYIMKL